MKYVYSLLAAAVALFLAAYGGYRYANNAWEAKDNALRAKDAQVATDLQQKLDTALNRSQTFTTTIIPQVPHVTNFYIPSPGAVSIPRPVYYLTWGSVRLWDDALQGSSSASGTTGPTAGPDPLELSTIKFDDAETNAILNFGQYRDCRTVVTGWQSWYAEISKVKP